MAYSTLRQRDQLVLLPLDSSSCTPTCPPYRVRVSATGGSASLVCAGSSGRVGGRVIRWVRTAGDEGRGGGQALGSCLTVSGTLPLLAYVASLLFSSLLHNPELNARLFDSCEGCAFGRECRGRNVRVSLALDQAGLHVMTPGRIPTVMTASVS